MHIRFTNQNFPKIARQNNGDWHCKEFDCGKPLDSFPDERSAEPVFQSQINLFVKHACLM